MLFYSFEFMYLFLPVTLAGYYLTGSKARHLSVKWIVLSSFFFYGWWNPRYLIFLVSSILFNYYFGLRLRQQKQKWLLWLSIGMNLFAISYFKYAGFLVSIINDLSSSHFSIGTIVLPLGISFFTFQQIAWLIDNYSGHIDSKDRGLWEYGQFVVFFPQLIAGPIVHHSEMMPQFFTDKNRFISWKNMAVGLSFFVFGLAKKSIVADNTAPWANRLFDAAQTGKELFFADAWIGALAYTTQIYYDFSGYADMAIGLALMFNICLPLNFDSPYKATSISDFWRRWHMTLGRFLRNYVYIPLGGSRCRSGRVYANLWFTMFVCGIWHGAAWTFILWGGLHGIFLIIERLWQRNIPFRLPAAFAWLTTFLCVVAGWVLFRAETLPEALKILSAMVPVPGTGVTAGLVIPELVKGLWFVVPALLISFFLPNTQQLMGSSLRLINPIQKLDGGRKTFLPSWRPSIFWTSLMVLLGLSSLYCLINQTMVQEFIYFQF
jgi:D-alanyl-lipoteichoic acid acyltransferase DltB (MBOAT superfamily)